MNIKLIKFGDDDFYKSLKHALAFNEDDNSEIQAVVSSIIKDIKNNGDSALLSYTKKFDHLESKSLSELELTQESLKEAYESLDRSSQAALNESAQRIRDYHQNQIQDSWDYVEEDGTRLGQKITAIDSVGLYVPGGKAAYPSSVLMNAIPAKVDTLFESQELLSSQTTVTMMLDKSQSCRCWFEFIKKNEMYLTEMHACIKLLFEWISTMGCSKRELTAEVQMANES